MGVTNNLDKMTIEEKIMAMEHLWDDLCRHAPDRLTQPWHEEVLSQRERAESVGEAQFIDWDVAKKKLRESLCSRLKVRGSRFEVEGSRFEVEGSRFEVEIALVPRTSAAVF